MNLKRRLVASLLVLPWFVFSGLVSPWFVPSAAAQQDYDRPPAGFGDDGRSGYGYGGGGGAPVDAPDPAGLAVRIGRLEGRVREMTGQIEELQNANRKLVEQLQHVQEGSGSLPPRTKRSEAGTPSVIAGEAGPAVDADGLPPKPAPRKSRDDAFDPDKAPANVPGQPRQLGSVASTQPDDGANAPMDLAGGKLRRSDGSDAALAPTLRLPSAAPKAAAPLTPNGTVVAEAKAETPREAFDVALGYYRDKQYDTAEKSFTAFIQKNPKNKLVAEATYYLGESYAQRGRSREAAEQYLKISTEFANSTRAPDAMLHLALSLKALGAKEQACATFSEVSRKYPNAPAYVRNGAEREAKRAQC